MLHAAENVRDLPIVFVIVGGGAAEEMLRAQISRRALDNVRLLGYQSRERMPEINAASDLGTIPMKTGGTTDTFPSKIYTIMACARPVLVSADADSELRWLVETARCGRVVPPDDPAAYLDAVRRAYAEREALRLEGERGRAYVEKSYSKEAVGKSYDELLRSLVGT
jgi:colanic acid biosynthesis glycosyl transferase WcaI